MGNPYLPYPVRIDQITTETEDRNLKTFKLVFLNPEDEKKFAYHPGQFAELSIAGKGEIPIGIASSPTEKGFLLVYGEQDGVGDDLFAQHERRRRHGDPGSFGKLVPSGGDGR